MMFNGLLSRWGYSLSGYTPALYFDQPDNQKLLEIAARPPGSPRQPVLTGEAVSKDQT